MLKNYSNKEKEKKKKIQVFSKQEKCESDYI